MLQKLQEKKKTLDNKRSHLIKLKDELVLIEKQINEREDKRKQTIAHLEIEGKEFETKNEQLKLQNEKLSKEKTLCPTCNQPISGEKNREIILNNKKQIEENNEKLKDLRQKIEKYKVVILPEYQLAKGKDMEVKKLEEETKEYFETTKTLLELDKYSQAYMKLQQAEVAVKTHQETLIDLEKIYKIKSKDLEKSQNFKENLDKFSKTLEEIEEKLEGKMEVKKELSQKVLDLSGRAGEAKQLIDRTIQIENLFNLKKKEKNKLTKEKEIFEELSLAFGKRGIQAMIIEAAIPEIEDEANRLLNKLTEGRMKVRFETQKETKTKVQTSEGKVHALVETLDIIISDEMGERNYDLYSGGETFRVNFAIRLAISKLLTHRAGAKLQFLIIDEGFGTQDATGRARLIEVIDAIKDDFEKILIITHLEELKDEFPVRIEVSKDASGSTFEMVGA
ncbi:hypothetical protein HYS91_01495 [Candidatus Daviesbacteria bacterium]|nr:hypothetical protein [Candidatus Daviesbacteria bacterium]